jgi:hypothetical protein
MVLWQFLPFGLGKPALTTGYLHLLERGLLMVKLNPRDVRFELRDPAL